MSERIDLLNIILEVFTPPIKSWLRKIIPIEYFLSLSSYRIPAIEINSIYDDGGFQVILKHPDRTFVIWVINRSERPRITVTERMHEDINSLIEFNFIVSYSKILNIIKKFYDILSKRGIRIH